jgi:hypothetical protein
MEDNELVKSSFSATINAPIEKIDIPSWCFKLPESEYRRARRLTAPPVQLRRLTAGGCRSTSRYSAEA